MRLHFLFPTRRPNIIKTVYGGGTQSYMYDVAFELSKRGYKVFIHSFLCRDEKDSLVGFYNIDFSGNPILRNINYLRDILGNIARGDVVILFDQAFGGHIPALIKKLKRFRLVFHTTNHYPWLEDEINPRLYWVILRIALSRCDIVSVGTEQLRRKVVERTNVAEDKVQVIPQSLSLRILNVAKNLGVSEKYGVKDDDFLLLFVGRIIPHKGILDLIKAMELLVSIYPNIKLILAGPRSEKHSFSGKEEVGNFYREVYSYIVSKGLIDNIIFTGVLHRRELLSLYLESDVFIFPSYKEGFGTALLEAMAFGKPVVTYNHEPLNIVVNEETGILAEPGNITELAKGISYFYENPSVARKYGLRARRRLKEEFSVERVCDRWEDMFRSLLNI